MIKRVCFYSRVHLGDLHLCRSYIRWFIEKFPAVDFFFTHNYSERVFVDIPKLEFIPEQWAHLPFHGDVVQSGEDVLYFNTWIGAGGLAIGCNFQAVHLTFLKYYEILRQHYPISEELPRLAPQIDFEHPEILTETTDNWFQVRNRMPDRKAVFVANNFIESNQGPNYHMNNLIYDLATQKPHCDFYLSNQVQPLIEGVPNIFYAEKIINSPHPFNMNELSYFSTKCEIVIGRGSGPFSFCETKDNLNKTWVSLTFPHLHADAFNGLQNFPNSGRYIHDQNPEVLFSLL